jgi:hypothetical protein
MMRFVLALLLIALAGELIARYSGMTGSSVYATIANAILLAGTAILFRLMAGVDDPQKFTQAYLLSIIAKILLASVLIVVLILIDKPHSRANVIFLFSMYVLYTVIEVLFLVRFRRERNGAKKNQKISF